MWRRLAVEWVPKYSSPRSKSHILVLIAQIHIHVLLDKAREKIVKESHDASWEDLCNSREISETKQTIASTHSMPDDLTNFNYEFKIKSISRFAWQQYSFSCASGTGGSWMLSAARTVSVCFQRRFMILISETSMNRIGWSCSSAFVFSFLTVVWTSQSRG